MFKYINQISEQSYLLDFGSEIDIEINSLVNLFAQKILNNSKKINELGIKNCVPSYNKILIQFDPLAVNKSKLINYIKSIKISKIERTNKKNIIEIPICYDDIFALDLNYISNVTKLSTNEIINEHLNTLFHVYMIGFLPGYPFMGNMSNKLSLSRKNTPRIKVPKGSVGIVDKICGIYPQESPGGWNILGRTPIDLFCKDKKVPLLIKPGDMVKFKQISTKEFNDYDQ
jgi:KipI family sensor histidine kinase inhibitor